jgi:hypothetical protein
MFTHKVSAYIDEIDNEQQSSIAVTRSTRRKDIDKDYFYKEHNPSFRNIHRQYQCLRSKN